jgi:hypothetical protein
MRRQSLDYLMEELLYATGCAHDSTALLLARNTKTAPVVQTDHIAHLRQLSRCQTTVFQPFAAHYGTAMMP